MPRAALKRRNNIDENVAPTRPSKRAKTTEKSDDASGRRTRVSSKMATKAAPKAAPKRAPKDSRKVEPRPAVNSLPKPAPHTTPCNTVFFWGTGEDGQFGTGADNLGEFAKPQRNKWFESAIEKGLLGGEGRGIESIASGGFFSLFVDEEGKIWSCGSNDDGSLGRPTENLPDPENPENILGTDVAQSFPRIIQSLVEENFRAVKVTAGGSIAGAIGDKGELRVWGTFRGSEGALGFSSGVKRQQKPTQIIDVKSSRNEPEKFVALASGNNHMLALTTHGSVLSWGAGEDGQLGRKIVERRKIHGVVPEKVVLGSRSRKAVAVGAGSRHSFAIDREGDVWAWGMDAMGQTGTNRHNRADDPTVLLPAKVDALSGTKLDGAKVVSCAGGDDHSLFLTDDGRVYACGKSHGGRLGLPKGHPALTENEDGSVPIPTLVPFPDTHTDDPVVQISVGTRASMAVTAAGALYSWGEANASELGFRDEETGEAATVQLTPKIIVKKEGGSWAAVSTSCGGQHVCALFRKKM